MWCGGFCSTLDLADCSFADSHGGVVSLDVTVDGSGARCANGLELKMSLSGDRPTYLSPSVFACMRLSCPVPSVHVADSMFARLGARVLFESDAWRGQTLVQRCR